MLDCWFRGSVHRMFPSSLRCLLIVDIPLIIRRHPFDSWVLQLLAHQVYPSLVSAEASAFLNNICFSPEFLLGPVNHLAVTYLKRGIELPFIIISLLLL